MAGIGDDLVAEEGNVENAENGQGNADPGKLGKVNGGNTGGLQQAVGGDGAGSANQGDDAANGSTIGQGHQAPGGGHVRIFAHFQDDGHQGDHNAHIVQNGGHQGGNDGYGHHNAALGGSRDFQEALCNLGSETGAEHGAADDHHGHQQHGGRSGHSGEDGLEIDQAKDTADDGSGHGNHGGGNFINAIGNGQNNDQYKG